MKLRLAALTLLSSAIIMPVTANAGGHTADKFMEADADNNGLVSKEEFTAKYDAKFTKMDGDGDGSVSAEEYEAYIHAKYEDKYREKFKKMDTDGDGSVSEQELIEHKNDQHHKHKH
jgi:Ca2+-binding EF-hand superfamily protein